MTYLHGIVLDHEDELHKSAVELELRNVLIEKATFLDVINDAMTDYDSEHFEILQTKLRGIQNELDTLDDNLWTQPETWIATVRLHDMLVRDLGTMMFNTIMPWLADYAQEEAFRKGTQKSIEESIEDSRHES